MTFNVIYTGCAAMPCQHGGSCQPVSGSSYSCNCVGGYGGSNCQELGKDAIGAKFWFIIDYVYLANSNVLFGVFCKNSIIFLLLLTVSGVTCTFNNGMCDFLSQSHDDNDDWLIGQVM